MLNYFSVISMASLAATSIDVVLDDAMARGKWLLFQRCHLAPSWLTFLEKKLQSLGNQQNDPTIVNPAFRLWMCWKPEAQFPPFLHRHCIKIAVEHPPDFKSAFRESFSLVEANFQPHELKASTCYRDMLFRICSFHACLRDVRNYGTNAFGLPYAFLDSDYVMSIKQLREMLAQHEGSINDKAMARKVSFYISELTYGAQIGDHWDRQIFDCLLQNNLSAGWNEEERGDSIALPLQQVYNTMQAEGVAKCWKKISEHLPTDMHPDMFGFAENAPSIHDRDASARVKYVMQANLSTTYHDLSKQPSIDYAFIEDRVKSIINKFEINLLNDLWANIIDDGPFLAASQKSTNQKYLDRLLENNVSAYRKLYDYVSESMKDLLRSLQGEKKISQEEESLLEDIFRQRIPRSWKLSGFFYRTNYTLNTWPDDFIDRLNYIQKWADLRRDPKANRGKVNRPPGPVMFNISRLFDPEAFFIAIRQDASHLTREPFESFELETLVLRNQVTPPDKGYYISGTWLQGTAWDFQHSSLKELKPHEEHFSVPCLWVQPMLKSDLKTSGGKITIGRTKKTFHKLSTPVYIYRPHACFTRPMPEILKSGREFWQGDSIATVKLSTDRPHSTWIMRNVAMICELPEENEHDR